MHNVLIPPAVTATPPGPGCFGAQDWKASAARAGRQSRPDPPQQVTLTWAVPAQETGRMSVALAAAAWLLSLGIWWPHHIASWDGGRKMSTHQHCGTGPWAPFLALALTLVQGYPTSTGTPATQTAQPGQSLSQQHELAHKCATPHHGDLPWAGCASRLVEHSPALTCKNAKKQKQLSYSDFYFIAS